MCKFSSVFRTCLSVAEVDRDIGGCAEPFMYKGGTLFSSLLFLAGLSSKVCPPLFLSVCSCQLLLCASIYSITYYRYLRRVFFHVAISHLTTSAIGNHQSIDQINVSCVLGILRTFGKRKWGFCSCNLMYFCTALELFTGGIKCERFLAISSITRNRSPASHHHII